MEISFTTTIDTWFLKEAIDVEITYTAEIAQVESNIYNRKCYEIEVLTTAYTLNGVDIEKDLSGRTWNRLENIAHDLATDHFFKNEAA